MDVKEFFYSGGLVACKDSNESDVVIGICCQEGFLIYSHHDPDGIFHGVFWNEDTDMIDFYSVGSREWKEGISFVEWMAMYDKYAKVPVEDLL